MSSKTELKYNKSGIMAINETLNEQADNRTSISHQSTQQVNNTNQINLNPEALDFDECLKDSPKFRHILKENLVYIEHLENCMSKTIKQVSNYIESGREHIKSQKDFIQSMRILNQALGPNCKETCKNVTTLLETLEEIMCLNEIVIDQSARTVGTSLSRFINDDLVKLKEARKSFDKISHEYDQALIKYSQPARKQQEDSENLLIATSTAFTHTSLDLSIQLTTLQSKKGFEILGSLLSFTKAHSTFFHQGSDLFGDLKSHINDMDEYLSNIQDDFETLIRNLPSKHLMVSNNELRPLCFDSSAEQVHLEGYLFKRASNGFKVWNRRWFILKNHQLMYQKRGETQPVVMEEDLRLLTVRLIDKADCDRRFCFEVVSPQKSHILQADSESACKTWINAIQAGKYAAFHDTEHKLKPKPTPSSETTASVANASSYWSSSFSLKALQQQATNKLNSIATLSDASGDTTKPKDKTTKSGCPRLQRNNSINSADEVEMHDCKIDEQGRTYAPLRDDDDQSTLELVDKNKTNDEPDVASYPAPAQLAETATTPICSTDGVKVDPPEKPQRAYMIILAMPGNDTCADCGASQPRWASINLGTTLCIECAGIHRSLGVHLSKVRSLTLDTEVWSPEIVQLMLSLGNTSVNSAYLACYRGQVPAIDADSSREDREHWIRSKYVLKSFMRPPGIDLDESTTSSISNNVHVAVANESDQVNEQQQQSSGQAPAVSESRPFRDLLSSAIEAECPENKTANDKRI